MSTKQPNLFLDDEFEETKITPKKVTCLGMEFPSDEARREYFREELRKKLPELKKIEGFPIGEDNDIINLSDPPYYTACPNPWLDDIITEWDNNKKNLQSLGQRISDFVVNGPYTDGIKVGKNSAIYNAHSYHTKVPYQIIMRYILHYTQPGDIVLDSFAGTGMTGVAVSACNKPDDETRINITDDFYKSGYGIPNWGKRYSICGDLSPICFHISSNYNHKTDTHKLQKCVDKILEKIKDRFGYLYEFEKSNGVKGHINYFVWSEICACNNCGHELNVHDLSYNYETKELSTKMKCPHCGTEQKRTESDSIFETIFDEITGDTYNEIKYNQCLLNYSL